MRRPMFIETNVAPDGTRTKERDGFLCAHCQNMVTVKPFHDAVKDNGFCSKCMAVICNYCVKVGKCIPFERKLERSEARHRALASYGLG